jgi:hypothetical protein
MAESLATDTRLVNQSLYDLRSICITAGSLTGTLSLTDFVPYAEPTKRARSAQRALPRKRPRRAAPCRFACETP